MVKLKRTLRTFFAAAVNMPALRRLFSGVASRTGVRDITLTHGTMAPVVVKPGIVDELHLAVYLSVTQHPEAARIARHRFEWKFYALGRRLLARAMKYPLFRLARLPEAYQRRHLVSISAVG